MTTLSPRELVERLADKYNLRLTDRTHHYVGVYKGLCIDAVEHGGTIHLLFLSPTADLSGLILEDFAAFEHLKSSSIPPRWLTMLMRTQYENDERGCILELGKSRLAAIDDDDFLNLPELIGQDFQQFGATSEIEACNHCGVENPQQLMFVGTECHVVCDRCLESLQDHAPDGQLELQAEVHWGPAAAALLAGTVVFSLVWGLVQQPEVIYGLLLMIVPVAGAGLLARLVVRCAGRATGGLRMATLLCIVVSIFVGNIWRHHTQLNRVAEVSWPDAIANYFTWSIPRNTEYESWFFVGGILGLWIAFRMMKAVGNVRCE